MSLFSFLRKKDMQNNNNEINTQGNTPDIPKDLFVDDTEPNSEPNFVQTNGFRGIQSILDFIENDFEKKGYEDAHTNPDDSYKQQNIQYLNKMLEVLIRKAIIYYDRKINLLRFHLETRKRAGLIDIVNQLQSQLDLENKEREKVFEIEKELIEKNGITTIIGLSYTRGFNRGLAAITYNQVLNGE